MLRRAPLECFAVALDRHLVLGPVQVAHMDFDAIVEVDGAPVDERSVPSEDVASWQDCPVAAPVAQPDPVVGLIDRDVVVGKAGSKAFRIAATPRSGCGSAAALLSL